MEELTGRSKDIGDDPFRKLDDDTIIHILKFLDTARDLSHAACVSHSWKRYVCKGCLTRELSMKCFPEVGSFKQVTEEGFPVPCEQSIGITLEREYFIYGYLLHELQAPIFESSCIVEPLHASSTDDFPRESIAQTLFPSSRHPDGETSSYWCSKGESDTDTPETLTYRLIDRLCVVHEVKIQPFSAYFQPDGPIYSAKSVRFRFGYAKTPRPHWSGLLESLGTSSENSFHADYIWTYESPKFPMAQEDSLQIFKLPRPVLCIGDVFQVELLGRVQTQFSDGLYYVCISHVSVHGRPLSDFDFEPTYKHNEYLLKYCQKDGDQYTFSDSGQSSSSNCNAAVGSSRWNSLVERFRQTRSNAFQYRNRSFFGTLLGSVAMTALLPGIDEDSDDEMLL